LGFVGIGLLGVLLITTYRAVIAKFRRDPEWGGLLLAYFIGAVLFSLTEAGFRMLSVSWTFLIFARFAATQQIPRASKVILPADPAEDGDEYALRAAAHRVET